MKISLVGPCSPQDMVDAFYPEFSGIALATPGYRGIPVSELARQLVLQGHQVQVVTLDYRSDIHHVTFQGSSIQIKVHSGRWRPRHQLHDIYRNQGMSMARTFQEFILLAFGWSYKGSSPKIQEVSSKIIRDSVLWTLRSQILGLGITLHRPLTKMVPTENGRSYT